jgi:hypothetical protein
MDAFIAWDGDHIGRLVGQKALHDDVEGLRLISHHIEAGNAVWKSWVELAGGSMISSGGDEGRASVPASKLAELPRVREQYATAVESPVSVGVGMKLSEAEKALVVAKLHGGDQILFYGPQIDEEIKKAREQKDKTPEGTKVLDAYLGKAAPAMNEGEGAGFGGQHPAAGAAAPTSPKAEASEHSETEGFLSMLNDPDRPRPPEGTHAARDMEEHFHGLAQQQAGADDQQRQVSEKNLDRVKAQVVQALQSFRAQAPVMEQIKGSSPELYQSMMAVVQAVITLGREVAGGQEEGSAVAKSEISIEPEEGDFEPLEKALPRVKVQSFGPPPGFVDSFDHVKSHVQRNDPHSGGLRGATKFGINQIRPDDYYWPKEPFQLDVNHEDLDTRPAASSDDVQHYVGQLKGGSEPPAIFGIYNPRGRFVTILDGAHRLESKQLAGHKKIGAYIGLPKEMAHTGHWIEKAVAKTVSAVSPSKPKPAKKGELTIDDLKRELEAKDPVPGGKKLDKAALPMPSPKGPSTPKVELPIGTALEGTGKVKVQHADGSTSWKSVRAGQIRSQDPTGHPTSSREPNAR